MRSVQQKVSAARTEKKGMRKVTWMSGRKRISRAHLGQPKIKTDINDGGKKKRRKLLVMNGLKS
jgi:hypothetical protein